MLSGDCRETLRALEPGSVQSVITSPPYLGLRDYGVPSLVWGGEEHEHEWTGERFKKSSPDTAGGIGMGSPREGNGFTASLGQFCACGAWLGSLGLEPTPDLFLEHMVEVFREVRRVLRDDGTLWLNLGDSYAGTNAQGRASHKLHDLVGAGRGFRERDANYADGPRQTIASGYKAKNLLMMPARVAMALQADGWTLRSMIPWLKRNSMPESVTDRPATACEYVFLLSKASRYFWDADAVRQPHLDVNRPDGWKVKDGISVNKPQTQGWATNGANGLTTTHRDYNPAGRNLRNADFFFQSWQGLLLDEQDDPLAMVVNPAPFKGSHFATFPPKLVEPMVKASTSERGQCPECGSPWVRVIERK
jgi:DNA modification methylase